MREVGEAKTGSTEREAAIALYRKHERLLEGWLRRKGVPASDRPDLLQEISLAVSKSPGGLLAADAPEAWLRRIAHRRYVDYVDELAKRRVVGALSATGFTRQSRTASSKTGWKNLVARCSAELPNDDDRLILELWHKQGLQPDEIAAELNKRDRRNSDGGPYTANIVSQRIKRTIVPLLAKFMEEGERA